MRLGCKNNSTAAQKLQKMVLQSELLPHGGFQQQGYAQDYYSKNGYGHKDDYYSENGSSMQMVRPHITTPGPAKHYAVGHESYGYPDSENGKHQNYHGHGYPSGTHHSDGLYGKTQGFYGQQSHGYPKPSYGMHQSATNVEYESHHGSYMEKRPSRYESMSYDYYGEDRNRCPPYYEQPHIPNNNWAAKGAEWVSKGI